jgi:hypothetical protein
VLASSRSPSNAFCAWVQTPVFGAFAGAPQLNQNAPKLATYRRWVTGSIWS